MADIASKDRLVIRLILVDDHKVMRDGLRNILSQSSNFEILDVADNGRSAVNLARHKKPDIIIMDLCMPDLNGIEASRQITFENPEAKIIILTMLSDKKSIDEAFKAGVSGYLRKDCSYEELIAAIDQVSKGNNYLSPFVTNMMVTHYVKSLRTAPEQDSEVLTAREKEVLQLIAEEHSTTQIARAMNLSPKTVESHRLKLMKKLKVSSTAGLTKIAIKLGLTPM